MPSWNNISLTNPITGEFDIKNVEVELNRRLRYYLSNIDVSQILFNLNDIGGTLNLSKGGTGASLSAPAADSIMFYDVSGSAVDWLTIGVGLAISGTTVYNTIFGAGATASFYKITASTANLADISSTNLATFNALGSSSGTFGKLATSSATIGQLGSTDQITANKLASSSATIGELGSTGSITANTIASSSAVFTELHASSATFGNSTSYTEFEEDGTLVSIGDARTYRDELGDVTKLKIAGIGISEDSTDSVVYFSTDSNLSDFIYTNVQLNHDKDLTSLIYPHIHWFQSSGNAPNFLLQYRWQSNGYFKTTGWTDLKCNSVVFSYTSGTLHQISQSTVGISPTTMTMVSDIVQFRLLRDNANNSTQFTSTDNYSLPTGILSFDVHLMQNTMGSRTEYSK